MKFYLLLLLLGMGLMAGCSSNPAWVMQMNSVPVPARIYSGNNPTQYLGTTPCYAWIPGGNGGGYWGQLKLWAIPVTNAPGVHQVFISFGVPNPGVYTKIPSAVFFDLTKTSSASPPQ
jgi:hypothetical protein